MQTNRPTRVLSVDPGYERLGVAILEKERVLFSDCIITKRRDPHFKRLNQIGKGVRTLIDAYSPDALAIESLFFNSNQKTAFQVAESRGVVLFASSEKDLPVYEFTPLQIKVAVTGYGRADKKQVIQMVSKLVAINKVISHDDEYDAIAVGITFFAHLNDPEKLSTTNV